jgi:thiol-disulfide isomerase/thioredoxin
VDTASPALIVACLCAQWCGVCREWRPSFEALATHYPQARFVWIDVEEAAETLDDGEVDNFPVLAVQRGAWLLHCDVLPQQPGTWARLIDTLAALDAADAAQTATRRRQLGGLDIDLRRFLR